MKIDDKPGLELIAEFQKIEIEITVKEESSINGDLVEFFGDSYSDDPLTFFTEWYFEFKFNNDYIVHNKDCSKTRFEYKDYISKEVNDFYREIGDVVEDDLPFSEKMIILNDYKTKFLLLSEMYKEDVYQYCNLRFNFLNHSNIRIEQDSDKNISKFELKQILHSFLTIQKQSILDILFFLESKISLLREISNYESIKSKSKGSIKRIEPIKNLNRFQIALLFDYLKAAGAIHVFSANTLAPIINQLTGHSENTLRTEALNKIIDIKKGKVGDKTQIFKEPDKNINVVKSIILSILTRIDEDLDTNKKLRESK
jgi:hypothetical protein